MRIADMAMVRGCFWVNRCFVYTNQETDQQRREFKWQGIENQ